MARVGVILSGCGVQDGSEIHESVLTLLALDEAGAEVVCAAPNKPQTRVVNHCSGKEVKESRNVLVESARIARGKIRDLATVHAKDLDAVILPGGYGAALNLCDFATSGANASVDPEVGRLLKEMHAAGKPIGAICIAPALLAALFGSEGVRLTIGTDQGTAKTLQQMGAEHVACPVDRLVVDEKNRVVTSPAYMLAESIKDLKAGITKVVAEVLKLAKQPVLTKA